jgi:hypothetical protein
MINRITFILVLVGAIVLMSAPGSAQEKQRTLLAPAYPGSVAEEYPAAPEGYAGVPFESRYQTLHSKDSFEKVRAFYGKAGCTFEEIGDDASGFYAVLVPATEVMAWLTKHGVVIGEGGSSYDTQGERAGVTIWGKPKSYNTRVVGVLDRLKGAYLMKFIGVEGEDGSTMANHLEDSAFTKVYKQYEHVQWEHFPTLKGRPMDETLIDKHYTTPAAALAKEQEELVKKMTALSTAGKYDEAGKVGDRMMQISTIATDYQYNWDAAIRCLQEMEASAYPVRILIDRPPAEWDLSGVKK